MTHTAQRHKLTADCPLSCLEYQLPAKVFNTLRRHLREAHAGHPTVGHVIDLHQQGLLSDIRGLGVGGIEVITSFLQAAGLAPANRDRARA